MSFWGGECVGSADCAPPAASQAGGLGMAGPAGSPTGTSVALGRPLQAQPTLC